MEDCIGKIPKISMNVILSIIIMVVMAFIGFLVGAFLNDAIGGAVLFAMISGIACIIQAINQKAD